MLDQAVGSAPPGPGNSPLQETGFRTWKLHQVDPHLPGERGGTDLPTMRGLASPKYVSTANCKTPSIRTGRPGKNHLPQYSICRSNRFRCDQSRSPSFVEDSSGESSMKTKSWRTRPASPQ